MSTVYKVILTGEQFRVLVKGEVLKVMTGPIGDRDVIELALSDIGLGVMKSCIEDQEKELNALEEKQKNYIARM
jgi:hypothetical protein